MNELVFKGTNNQVLTNSLLVAEKSGKEHRRVMQDIRELGCSQSFREHNFVLSSYNSLQNKELPMYAMTKDGFTLLAMGYTGELAMKFKEEYISAFNKMEQIIKSGGYQIPSSFKEALLLAAHQQEQIDEQQKQISVMSTEIVEMKKKTDYLEIILSSKGTVVTTQIAQDYGMSAKAFNRLLADKGIQRRVNGQWILYAPYMSKGYVHSKSVNITHKDGRPDVKMNTEWTQRGRLFIYETLKRSNILPLIERNIMNNAS